MNRGERARGGLPFLVAGAAALLMSAGGAWWFLQSGPDSVFARRIARTKSAAMATGADGPAAREPEKAPTSPAVAAGEQVARELGLELATGSDDGPVLIAVEKGSGKPIAGALVIVHEYCRPVLGRRPPAEPTRPPHRLDFLRWKNLWWRQKAYVADDDGRVRVQRLVANAVVVAWHPSFHGVLRLRDQLAPETRVELEATRLVRVRVVDVNGAPRADVPIEFTEATKEKRTISRGFRSGADGLVELHPLEALPPEREPPAFARVALAIPWVESRPGVERLIDPNHLPDETIELTVPATGSIAIRVVDGLGNALPGASASYQAGIVEPGDSRSPEEQIERTRRDWRDLPLDHGECVLAPVGLDLFFRLEAGCRGHEGRGRVVAGPRTDGERIECVLALADHAPTLTGRIIDGEGNPRANSQVMVQFVRRGSGPLSDEPGRVEQFETDAAGRFRTDRPSTPLTDALLRFTEVDGLGYWLAGGDRPVGAAADDPLDVGDVVVEDFPVLVAGVVVDHAGVPVEAAEIAVEASPRGQLLEELGPVAFFPGVGTVSGADGRFEVDGPPGEFDLTLVASSDLIRERGSVEASLGQRDVRVVLERQRSFEASVLLDDGVPRSAIRAQFRAVESDPWTWDQGIGPDRRFTLYPLESASFDVRFIARGLEPAPVELLLVENVHFAEDAPTCDPRLDPADLRGRLTVSRIALHDAEGRPIAGARATLWNEPVDGAADDAFFAGVNRLPDFEMAPVGFSGSPTAFDAGPDGVLSVVAARAGLPLLIEAPGFVSKRVETSADDVDLLLDRSRFVRLEFKAEWWIRQIPYHLRASLTLLREEPKATPTRALRADETLDAPVGGAGRYRVRVTVARRLDDGRLLERELPSTPAVIDVGDPPTVLPIEVRLDHELLRRFDPRSDSSH